ncbi:hypothetical protein [Desulfosarcina cetonica]
MTKQKTEPIKINIFLALTTMISNFLSRVIVSATRRIIERQYLLG